MDRIIAPDSVDFAHRAVPPGAGTPQYASDGPPGTVFPAYQYNAIQEELIASINGLGPPALVPDNTDLTQLLQAIRYALGHRRVKDINPVDSPYTLLATDVGTRVRAVGGGTPIVYILNAGVFQNGDYLICDAYTASLLTIQRGAGVELRITSDNAQADADRTIGTGGRCELNRYAGGSEIYTVVDLGQTT